MPMRLLLRPWLTACLLAMGGLMWSLTAASQSRSLECSEALTQTRMNECAHEDYLREEQLLVKNTQHLMTQLDASKQRSFKVVQRTWFRFRRQQCDFEASRYEGGSIAPMVYATCMADLTQQRNKELKVILNDNH